MEIWKDIEGYEGYYQVSNLGRVKSLIRKVQGTNTKSEEFLKLPLSNSGYHRVHLSKKSKVKLYSVHRLVAIAFIQNIENKPQVNHKNGIKTDNRCDNLEWCTISENRKHSYDNGFQSKKGINHHLVKLTEEQVRNIKYNDFDLNNVQLSKIYGVKRETIRDIRNRKNWKHI